MQVSDSGMFRGLVLSEQIVPSNIQDEILKFNTRLGGLLARYGYRGHYDIDFVVSDEGFIYMTEINLRRSGGSHVLDIRDKLDIADRCLLSIGRCSLDVSISSDIKLFYDVAEKHSYNELARTGIIFVSTRALEHGRPNIGIVAVGENIAHTRYLLEEFSRDLATYSIR